MSHLSLIIRQSSPLLQQNRLDNYGGCIRIGCTNAITALASKIEKRTEGSGHGQDHMLAHQDLICLRTFERETHSAQGLPGLELASSAGCSWRIHMWMLQGRSADVNV